MSDEKTAANSATADAKDRAGVPGGADVPSRRQNLMRLLALAEPSHVETLYNEFADRPDWHFVRRPETGLVMVQGRIGGGGAPFNVGEMSVSRASVRLEGGEVGHAYIKGRNHRHTAIAAFFDALFQAAPYKSRLDAEIVAPLTRALAERDERQDRQAAATKVDFFTMARGED